MHVPVFFTLHVLVKASPGLYIVPSGTLTSPTNTASSRQGEVADVEVAAAVTSVARVVGVGAPGTWVAGIGDGEAWGVADPTTSVGWVVGEMGVTDCETAVAVVGRSGVVFPGVFLQDVVCMAIMTTNNNVRKRFIDFLPSYWFK